MSGGLERRLQFASQSQSQTASPPTMSQNLANAFRGCQIQSQSQRFPGFDLSQHLSCSQARPAAVQPSQPNCESTSQEFLRCGQAYAHLPLQHMWDSTAVMTCTAPLISSPQSTSSMVGLKRLLYKCALQLSCHRPEPNGIVQTQVTCCFRRVSMRIKFAIPAS